MAADGRLRQLNDITELGDCNLAVLENREHTDSDRVGKDRKLINDGGGFFHPYNRMKGYMRLVTLVNQGGRQRISRELRRLREWAHQELFLRPIRVIGVIRG